MKKFALYVGLFVVLSSISLINSSETSAFSIDNQSSSEWQDVEEQMSELGVNDETSEYFSEGLEEGEEIS